MAKEQICYYCKHSGNVGLLCPEYRCEKTGQKKESFDSCSDWEGCDEREP